MTDLKTLRIERTFEAPAEAVFEAFTKVDPPTRLAFTWIWDEDPRGTLIEVDFSETEGATYVRFTHSHLWDEEVVRSHEDGWGKVFDNLERVLASGW